MVEGRIVGNLKFSRHLYVYEEYEGRVFMGTNIRLSSL
jgi:hypothetical protein